MPFFSLKTQYIISIFANYIQISLNFLAIALNFSISERFLHARGSLNPSFPFFSVFPSSSRRLLERRSGPPLCFHAEKIGWPPPFHLANQQRKSAFRDSPPSAPSFSPLGQVEPSSFLILTPPLTGRTVKCHARAAIQHSLKMAPTFICCSSKRGFIHQELVFFSQSARPLSP